MTCKKKKIHNMYNEMYRSSTPQMLPQSCQMNQRECVCCLDESAASDAGRQEKQLHASR